MFPPLTLEVVAGVERHKWMIFNSEARRYFEDMPTRRYRTCFDRWDVTVVTHANFDLSGAELALLKTLLKREITWIATRRFTWITLIDFDEYQLTPANGFKK